MKLMVRDTPRFLVFDLMRIIAIVLVVIAHIAQVLRIPILDGFYGIQHFYFVSPGGFGVTLFLIISGAVLRLNRAHAGEFREFIAKRLLRIYPIYWLTNALILMAFAFNSHLPNLGIRDLLLSIAGMYAFVGEWGGPINDNYWFIGLIVFLYLLFPFVCNQIHRNGWKALFVLLAISVLSRWHLGQIEGDTRMIDWFPLCRIFEFGLGVFVIEKGFYLKILNTSKVIIILSNLSYYIFLIHNPLLYIIKTNLLIYSVSIICISYVLYAFDDIIIQTGLRRISEKFKIAKN